MSKRSVRSIRSKSFAEAKLVVPKRTRPATSRASGADARPPRASANSALHLHSIRQYACARGHTILSIEPFLPHEPTSGAFRPRPSRPHNSPFLFAD